MELEKLILNELTGMNLGGAIVTHVSFMGDGTVINFDIGALKIVFLIKDDVIAQTNSAMNTGVPITDPEVLRQVDEWANYVYVLAHPVVKKHRTPVQVTPIPVAAPVVAVAEPVVEMVQQAPVEQAVAQHLTPEQQLLAQQQLHQQQMPAAQALSPQDEAQAKYEALLKEMEAMKESMADEKPKPKKEPVEPEPPSTKKKVMSFVGNVVFYVVLIVVVAGVALFGMQEEGAPPRNLFGYSVMTVLTGSMYPELPIGTLVVMGPVEDHDIQVGDVITFIRNDRRTITHRVVEVRQDHQNTGRPGFQTKGDAVPTVDPEIVAAQNVIGEIIWSNYTLGQVIVWIQDHIIIVVMGVVMVAALVFVVKKFFLVPDDYDDEEEDDEDEDADNDASSEDDEEEIQPKKRKKR